jgi:hypothetical protein
LPRDIRHQLDKFSEEVDRIGFDQLPTFVVTPNASAHRDSIEAAELAGGVQVGLGYPPIALQVRQGASGDWP